MRRNPIMMLGNRIWATALVLAAAACTLGACSGDRPPLGSSPEPASAARAAAPRAVPLADMAGRWMLGSPGAGQCSMTFTGAPGAIEGTIAPEGGCPGKFFTSRRWVFDQDALVIRNHTGEPLGRLAVSSPGRFDGQAASGETVSLAR
jgi:hypothetical protein